MEKDNMSDLLNTFKSVLNNNSTSSSQLSETADNKLNITPEMITQLADNLKNQTSQSSSSDNTNPNTNTNTNINSNHNSSNNNFENNINLDFDTILKFKKIIESFNQKNDTRSNLLYSLKPYLRESRQKKIDQYANIFKLSGIAKILKNEKGDPQ